MTVVKLWILFDEDSLEWWVCWQYFMAGIRV